MPVGVNDEILKDASIGRRGFRFPVVKYYHSPKSVCFLSLVYLFNNQQANDIVICQFHVPRPFWQQLRNPPLLVEIKSIKFQSQMTQRRPYRPLSNQWRPLDVELMRSYWRRCCLEVVEVSSSTYAVTIAQQ